MGQKRIIKRENLTSQFLQDTKEILIFLPPNYDETHPYPWMILHDGNDYFNLGRIVTQATQMIADNLIHPLILVAVPVDKSVRTSEYSPVGSRNQLHQRMIVEELIPMIQDRYSVHPDQLVVGGSSLGGTVSLHLALQYPHLFKRVLSQSGAFLKQTKEEILQTQSLKHLTIYQSIGKSETAVPTHMGNLDLVARNRVVHQYLNEKEAHVHYVEEEGDHTWGFWQKDLPSALQFFFGK
ncbi:alpha/beta hydrolase [Hazenella coriacea]|uniref:Enterochelin esterase-like enzyme n=1 Tax=Hazenella coriacea TaxID=1179467 RepID=A0A4R3L851_9BACL|nr:alpha/beta hydrolase-fold protein [Hazenella coriacea]TCS95973.1 enterochelin esterase-like enzyme [Hazenella coriacea]